MQRFVGFVSEKGILPDLLAQRRAADKIRMEQQSLGFGGRAFEGGISNSLAWSHTDYRPVVEVVLGLSVIHRAGHGLFQEDSIETYRHAVVSLALHRIELHESYLRMAGLETEQIIVLFDGVYFENSGFVHIHKSFDTAKISSFAKLVPPVLYNPVIQVNLSAFTVVLVMQEVIGRGLFAEKQ